MFIRPLAVTDGRRPDVTLYEQVITVKSSPGLRGRLLNSPVNALAFRRLDIHHRVLLILGQLTLSTIPTLGL